MVLILPRPTHRRPRLLSSAAVAFFALLAKAATAAEPSILPHYDRLVAHFQHVGSLKHAYCMLEHDASTTMPTGGQEVRSASLAVLAELVHNELVDPRVGDWLRQAEAEADLTGWQLVGFPPDEGACSQQSALEERGRRDRSRSRGRTDFVPEISRPYTITTSRREQDVIVTREEFFGHRGRREEHRDGAMLASGRGAPRWRDAHVGHDAHVGAMAPASSTNSHGSLHELHGSLLAMKQAHQAEICLSAAFVRQRTIAEKRCEHAWVRQRPAGDWAGHLPYLEEVFRLGRLEADMRARCRVGGVAHPFDAILGLAGNEPGITVQRLDALFDEMKTWLPELIKQTVGQQSSQQSSSQIGGEDVSGVSTPSSASDGSSDEQHIIRRAADQPTSSRSSEDEGFTDFPSLQIKFPEDLQRELCVEVMRLMGFDFARGRLDTSAHPICTECGNPNDVRVTIR